MPKNCLSCLSLAGVKRISPGPNIYNGKYWTVDHAYPVGLFGWLVIVPKRHVIALHNLKPAEWSELTSIQQRVIKALHKVLKTDKEYSVCFAEQAGYSHIHFHIIPRTKAIPKELRGSKVFKMMKPPFKPVAPKKVIEICKKISKVMV